ncbi:DISARM system phospholipase D-like protein DrmC [Paenibacillus terreus]|uniref:DISARM system phospholipase D-like protein DrmC n=1 Tax=Paenibacillus terreus TaxID=1387834 RepID=A0ABV5B5J0_9BACL
MDDLWQVIAELGNDLHPDRIAIIATRIKSLRSADEMDRVKTSFGPYIDQRLVDRLKKAWRDAAEVGPKEVAAGLLAASATSSISEHRGSIELVWTGPSTGMVPVRHTEQVLREIIESAKKRLFLVSFVAYEVDSIIRALRDAMDRQVQVNVLLESSQEYGGRLDFDSVKAMRESLPLAYIYVWNTDVKKKGYGQVGGAVHAKCLVADGKFAFITSANLSAAAMERNMELGVLVKWGTLPDQLECHLEALINTGIVELI